MKPRASIKKAQKRKGVRKNAAITTTEKNR
jgi:hypothetical protein